MAGVGLKKAYGRLEGLKQWLRSLMCLCFLPHDLIIPTFEEMLLEIDDLRLGEGERQNLDKVVRYYKYVLNLYLSVYI